MVFRIFLISPNIYLQIFLFSDKSGQMKAVDHVVGLKFVVHIGKRMGNGYTNYVLNKIFPARTTFSDDIIDQV